MKSQETDIRDHDSAKDAYYAQVERSRAANADKQAGEMACIFGPVRLDPDPDKPAGGNRWSLRDLLDAQR